MENRKACILVVDDQPENLLILEDLLGEQYAVHTAANGQNAVDFLVAGGCAELILLDVMMPGMDGFEVCRKIKSSPTLSDTPVLFLTSLESQSDEAYALSLGAEDFIHKPFSPPVVMARINTHLQLAHAKNQLKLRNQDLQRQVEERTQEIVHKSEELVRRTQEIVEAQSATITAFCALAEARDNETGNHIRRTQSYVRTLAEQLRNHPRFRQDLTDEVILLLFKSAPLHDVGKVAIPDAILNKPGKLTPEEWQIMQQHAKFGHDAISQVESGLKGENAGFLRYAREIAYNHHEKWDGTGYPRGLAGDAIPLSARLMAVADVYDALISQRVYKPAYSHEEAVRIIAEGRGTHFDPDIADAMLEIAYEFRQIAASFRDEGQLL